MQLPADGDLRSSVACYLSDPWCLDLFPTARAGVQSVEAATSPLRAQWPEAQALQD